MVKTVESKHNQSKRFHSRQHINMLFYFPITQFSLTGDIL